MSSSGRPRHQRSDYEKLLKRAEREDWRVERKSKHFMLFCPCPGRHIVTVSATPSDTRSLKKIESQLKTCKLTEQDT